MIDRYDFWTKPLSLRRMMDRLFEDAFVLPADGQAADASSRAMNVYEDGQNLVFETHLPGFKPEDIDVTVEQRILTIRCRAKAEDEQKDRQYWVRQHRMESFVRSLRLPDAVDVDAAQATFEHGVLRLVFPRTEQVTPRRVPIAMGGQAAIDAAPSAEPSAGTPDPRAEQAADLPTPRNGEAANVALGSDEPTGSTKAEGKGAGGRASGRKAAGGKAADRKSPAQAPAGVGA